MVRCLQKISSPPYSVAKIFKCGSRGKGTSVDDSDIDLVVYFNGIHNIEDLKQARPILLHLIKAEITKSFQGPITLKTESRKSVSYSLGKGSDVDILPAFDVVNELRCLSNVYREMEHYQGTKASAAQEYSASLAPIQREFVKKADCRVKEAVRKMKEWKDTHNLDIRAYSLELLALSLHKPDMSTEELVKKCMCQMAHCQNLRVAFDEHYKSARYVGNQTPPYILDPVNPYNNTLHGVDSTAVVKAANAYLRKHYQ